MSLYDKINPYVPVENKKTDVFNGGGLTIVGRDINTLIPHDKLNHPSDDIKDLTTVFMRRKYGKKKNFGRLLIRLGDIELCIDQSPKYYNIAYAQGIAARGLIERVEDKGYDCPNTNLGPFLVTNANITESEKKIYGKILGYIKVECEVNKRNRRHFRMTLGFTNESETLGLYDSDNSIIMTKNELLKFLDALITAN